MVTAGLVADTRTATAAAGRTVHGAASAAGPVVGVLALQGDVREHLTLLRGLGAEARTVRTPSDLVGCRALVLPGGESTTMARLIEAFGLEAPLRAAIDAGVACLATCAGTILLARAIQDGLPGQLTLGVLDIAVRRNAYGGQRESFEADVQVPALGPDPVSVAFIRAPAIEAIGPEVEVLARHAGTPVAVRQGLHLALTFHPEITGDPRLHALFLRGLEPAPAAGG